MSIVTWLYFLLTIGIAFGWLGAGAAFVRRAHKTAGMLLIGAGALGVLSSCCLRAMSMFSRDAFGDGMFGSIVSALGALVWLVEWTLVAVSLSMLAKELKARKSPPAPRVF